MNCYLHSDVSATAFCRGCGRALCPACQIPADGTVFCAEHVPASAYAPASGPYYPSGTANYLGGTGNPYTAPPPPPQPIQTSPGLAFLLGLIPGVGAIYNGQYVKGLMHAVIFGLLVSITSNIHGGAEPLFGILIAVFFFYMPFEAYHTARKRQLGLALDEWSSLVVSNRFGSRAPVGPVLLIGLGVLFLLDSLHILPLSELGRFWPVLLILIGAGMLYGRISSTSAIRTREDHPVEGIHERQ
jgi:Domain of unknown function (DUF5668)